MKKIFIKAWNDSVLSKVIATAITGLGAVLCSFLWNRLSISTFNFFKDWLSLTYSLPNWTIFLFISLFALITYLLVPQFRQQDYATPDRNRELIEKAVYEKRNITGFDLVFTGIRNDNFFLEFCLKDFSETWLIQEINNTELTSDVKRQIKIVNRHLSERESRHSKVIIILLVYRFLKLKDKTDLYNQLLLFNSSENLNQKISFQVWDKTDIDKMLTT